MLGVIEDLVQSVNRKKTSFMSFTSIHCSIQHMLKTIYFKLLEIPYDSSANQMSRPRQSFVENQRPCIVNYTIDVLKFLNTITFKIQTEVHLIRHLFCQKEEQLILVQYDQTTGLSTSRISPIKDPEISNLDETMLETQSQDICLPFQILVYYFKHAKQGIMTEMEKNFIDDLIVLSFNTLSIDSKFVCYFINESDFIEILMTDITEAVESLPPELDPLDILGNFNIVQQIEEKHPIMIEQQLQDLVNSCRILNEVFLGLDVLVQRYLAKRSKSTDYQSQLRSISQVQKAFMEGFIDIVLIKCFQPKILHQKEAELRTSV